MDDGREYFWHLLTHQSQWEPPEGGLPPLSDPEQEQEDEEEETEEVDLEEPLALPRPFPAWKVLSLHLAWW